MSFATPSLDEAVQRARARMRAEQPGTDAAVWPNTQYVTAKTIGGESWELYGFLTWISKQRFATTADGDMLDEIGGQFGVNRRPATYAAGMVNIVGTPAYTIDAGTRLQRSDGKEFATNGPLMLDANGTGRIGVTALATGRDYNTDTGAVLTGVFSSLSVALITVDENGIGGGASTEQHEDYRARILFRLRYPPHGGAPHDYVAWSLEVPGITRVWVDPLAYGPGTVGVWVMADGNGTQYGVPSGTDLDAVRAHIAGVKPATARVIVKAPKIAALNVKLAGIVNPSSQLQGQIRTELRDAFRRGGHVSMPNAPFIVRNNLLWQAVARATGDAAHAIEVPTKDTPLPLDYLADLGTLCYV